MASSGNIAALRVELESARSSLLPQIHGLSDLASIDDLSDAARNAVTSSLNEHSQRLALIDQTLEDMVALEADGYPNPLTMSVPGPVSDELLAHYVMMAAGLAELPAQAVTAIITLGTPVDQ
jgi:hypothetical protein